MNLKPMPVILALLAGCGSGTTPSSTTTNGFNTAPGLSVVAAGVIKVTFTSLGGGFHGSPPSGAACDPAQWTYNIGLDGHTLQAKTCKVTGDANDPASYFLDDEPYVLTDAQWTTLNDAVVGVTVSGKTSCGADADQRELTVWSEDDSLTYGDDFNTCVTTYERFATSETLGNLQLTLQADL